MTREQVKRTIPRKWGPILALFAILVVVGTALAVHNDGYFELDGNATSVADDGAPFGFNDGEDWDKICPAGEPAGAAAPCTGGSAAIAKFFKTDDNRIFTGGSTKDDLDVTGWLHTTGSVPDKDELLHGFAARYGDHVYFGADRFANSGDAQMGVWFFQSAVGPITSGANAGKFSGSHRDGDILVLSDFTRGGTQPTIRVFRWNGPGGSITTPATINGTLDLLAGTATDIRDCLSATLSTTDPFCATVNTGVLGSPWAFVPKSGPAGSFQKGEFYEGGIDLAFLNLQDECFSSVILETRSSTSVDAVLKDFVAGAFESCGANISIAGTATNEVNAPHTFTVTVTKTIGGTQTGVLGVVPTVTLTSTNGATITNTNTSDCDDGTNASGVCLVTFTSTTAGVVTGHASANVVISGTTFPVETDGLAGNSGDVIKTFVDARIGLSPLTDTNGIGESHTVTVTVDQNAGDAAGFVDATNGHVDVVLTDAGGSAASLDATASTCDNAGQNLTAAGTCVVVFSSPSAGTVTINASVSLTVGGLTLIRDTDPLTLAGAGPGGTGPATKVFKDGTLRWLKFGPDGTTLLAGAKFAVCRTHTYSSASDSMVDSTDVCLGAGSPAKIDDDVAAPGGSGPNADNDPTGGEFQLSGLVLGRYTIVETDAPAGYGLDLDTETVDLTTANPSNADATAGDVVPAFVNPQLFRIIVMTCNDTVDTLVDGTVVIGGTTYQTITSVPAGLAGLGVTEAQLCGILGASKGDLPASITDVPVSVEVPDRAPLFP